MFWFRLIVSVSSVGSPTILDRFLSETVILFDVSMTNVFIRGLHTLAPTYWVMYVGIKKHFLNGKTQLFRERQGQSLHFSKQPSWHSWSYPKYHFPAGPGPRVVCWCVAECSVNAQWFILVGKPAHSTLHSISFIFWCALWISTKFSPDLDVGKIYYSVWSPPTVWSCNGYLF